MQKLRKDASASPVNVIVLDRRPLFIEGLIATLAQYDTASIHFADSLDALKDIAKFGEMSEPHLLIVGPNIPTPEGFAACRWMQRHGLRRVIYISQHVSDPIFIADAAITGVSVCLPADATPTQLLETISSLLMSDGLTMDDDAIGNYRLSPRELEIIRLWAEGQTDKQVAEALDIAKSTARNHAQRILVRLNVHNRRDAIHRARHLGLI